jgi:hypothetical protein
MTCAICNIHKGQFLTEKEYQIFLKNLNKLTEKKLIKKIQNINKKSPFFEDEYICLHCKQIWLLMVPDQAFRGGWNAKQ